MALVNSDNRLCQSMLNQNVFMYNFFLLTSGRRYTNLIVTIFFTVCFVSTALNLYAFIQIRMEDKKQAILNKRTRAGDLLMIGVFVIVGSMVWIRLFNKCKLIVELIQEIRSQIEEADQKHQDKLHWSFRLRVYILKTVLVVALILYLGKSYYYIVNAFIFEVRRIPSTFFRISTIISLVFQMIVYLIIPIQIFVENNFQTIFLTQMEQFAKNLRQVLKSGLIFSVEQLTTIRQRFNSLSIVVIKYDRIFHVTFLLIYFAVFCEVIISSLQVRIIHGILYENNNTDTIKEDDWQLAEENASKTREIFLIWWYITIGQLLVAGLTAFLYMSGVYRVNDQLDKPKQYVTELSLLISRQSLDHHLIHQLTISRLSPRYAQLTIFRKVPIKRKFFFASMAIILMSAMVIGDAEKWYHDLVKKFPVLHIKVG